MSKDVLDYVEQEQKCTPQAPTNNSIDLNVLASFDDSQLDGEPSFTVELIDLYLDEVPRLLGLIHNALQSADWNAIRLLAHTLKGCSANLGILQLALVSAELEHLEFNEPSAGRQLLLSLEAEFDRVRKILLVERQRRM
jgi:HPt (histidine-containing phosphotransfer) domain-containing protein